MGSNANQNYTVLIVVAQAAQARGQLGETIGVEVRGILRALRVGHGCDGSAYADG